MTCNPSLPCEAAVPKEHRSLVKACSEPHTQRAFKNVFIRSKPDEWSRARVLEEDQEEATVQVFESNGNVSIQTVSLKDYPGQSLPLQNNMNEYDDMIDLPFLHEASMQHIDSCELPEYPSYSPFLGFSPEFCGIFERGI